MCTATGDPIPTVYWTKNGENLRVPTSADKREPTAELVIENFDVEDEGNYSCVGKNSLGHIVVAVTKLCKYLIKVEFLKRSHFSPYGDDGVFRLLRIFWGLRWPSL